jgi:hypothetical protein
MVAVAGKLGAGCSAKFPMVGSLVDLPLEFFLEVACCLRP